MKKILTIATLFTILTFAIAPLAASADTSTIPGGCTISGDRVSKINGNTDLSCGSDCDYEENSDCGMCCLLNTVYTVTDWLFFAISLVAVIFILIGGWTFVTAGGNAENTAKGRNYLIMAAIGILIALLARAVPSIVMMATGA
jgi:hypothetical protein